MSRPGKTIIGSTDRGPWQIIAVLGWLAGVRALFIMVCLAACTVQAGAVIFYATADPTYNTTAPTGSLNNSGWQWVGYWDGFQGTPIGPHHFLTARHVGGAVGDQFIFGGVTYITTVFYDDTVSDLRICEISGSFPTWASLYRTSDEVGRSLTVFGRGLSRGAEVRDAATNTLRGWQWGSGGGVLRWGQNTVASVEPGGSYWGDLLYATFDAGGGANEAHLAVGDSSGPVFINDGTAWRLAGIAAAVDAYFNTTNSGSGFNAAIFDARGLYIGSSGSWTLISGPTAIPSGFYATRVSERTAWIDGIVPPQDPDNSGDAPLLSPAGLVVLAGLFFGFGARALRRPVGPVPLT